MSVVEERTMAQLGRIGDALGDPTRRAIYRRVLEANEALTAGEIGEEFGLHRTVARSHLEKLVENGLLQINVRRKPKGGRPAKIYSSATERLDIQLPARRYETLARLLLQVAMQQSADLVPAAEELGRTYGRGIARSLTPEGEVETAALEPEIAAQWLCENGYRAQAFNSGRRPAVIEVANCVYLEAAGLAPELVCSFDRGMLCGMLGVPASAHTQTASILTGEDHCRHEFVL